MKGLVCGILFGGFCAWFLGALFTWDTEWLMGMGQWGGVGRVLCLAAFLLTAFVGGCVGLFIQEEVRSSTK